MTLQSLRILILCCLWLLGKPLQSNAQFNLEAGYSYSFYQPKALNTVLQSYEGQRVDLNSSLGDTKGFHGLEFAGIYNWETFSFGLVGSFKRDRNTIDYTALDGSTTLEESVIITNSFVGLVLQSNMERFSIGTRSGYDFLNLKFKGNIEYPDRKHSLDNGLASQFYLSYTLPGNDLLRMSIRPFYQINWYTRNYQSLADQLEVPTVTSERAQQFGISLIFVNGPDFRY